MAKQPYKQRIEKSVTLSGNALNKKVHLGKNTAQNIQQVTNLMVDIIKRQRRLWRTELNHWHSARYARYSVDYPSYFTPWRRYTKMYSLTDTLTGITENRTLRTTNRTTLWSSMRLRTTP